MVGRAGIRRKSGATNFFPNKRAEHSGLKTATSNQQKEVLLRSSLNIDIFKISLSISISILIFLKYFLSISISISIFSKTTISISISISIFLELPYRYRYRYRYFSELPYRYRYFSKVSIYRQSICHIDISNRARNRHKIRQHHFH